jgi:hypothetical protein
MNGTDERRKRRIRFLAFLVALSAALLWASVPATGPESAPAGMTNGMYVRRNFIEGELPGFELNRLMNICLDVGARDLYFHHTPAAPDGSLQPLDIESTVRTVKHLRETLPGVRLLLWIGGRTDKGIDLDDAVFRRKFTRNAVRQLEECGFDGLHLNFEPLPSGDEGFLALLDEMRPAMPEGKTLSVAAIAPPTWFRTGRRLCWSWDYYREVATRTDQLMVMSYDTAIPFPRLYQAALEAWVRGLERELNGTDCEVLMGVPCYGEPGWFHHPWAENREVAEAALFSAIGDGRGVVKGVAYYAEWTM